MAHHNDLIGHNTSPTRNNKTPHTQPPSRRRTNPIDPCYDGITFAMCLQRAVADFTEAWRWALGSHRKSWRPNFRDSEGMDVPVDVRFDFVSVP